MNYGPLVYLAALLALAGSWFGYVLTPQMQVGHLQQTNTIPAGATYPLARPGLARQGLDVYRANGCQYCHSQQIGQTGTACDVLLTEAGTNQTAVIGALREVRPGLTEAEAKSVLGNLHQPVLEDLTKDAADAAAKTLSVGGAKAQVWIRPTGPDIARGWGKRRTVAEDFLFDDPVMLGAQRIGPDLANVGVRWPDINWHLRHLYSPQSEVKGSTMPTYRYLFEKRRVERAPSPDALNLPAGLTPEPGYEIVPKQEARALAVYLTSLQANAPLFVAPLSVPAPPPAEASTNAPAGTNTTSTATNAPSK